ncbi:O-antigen ligase family protein [Natronolimnobius sp. AArcel1]|uniref:O-antigen ligase family protein n=1 Tax=Natronolimnobius sp. AArcel1 TaxID=1679093 RepID=UPI0013EB3A55|nr:O-antigen ligase family protein [Natronolimnobius sp. AArcel1]NGM69092.1 O-antigen ligase family protein [Natronolimnobius sp. AArcel1]
MQKENKNHNFINGTILLFSYMFIISDILFSNITLFFEIDINNLFALLLVLFWVIGMYVERSYIYMSKIHIVFLILLTYYISTILWSVSIESSIFQIIVFSYLFLVFLVIYDVYDNEGKILYGVFSVTISSLVMVWTVLIGYFLHTFIGFDQSWWMVNDPSTPISWHFPSVTPETTGVTISIGMICAWYLYNNPPSSVVKYTSISHLALSPFALVLVASRQGFAAFSIVCLYIVLTVIVERKAGLKDTAKKIGYVSLPVLVSFIFVAPAVAVERVIRFDPGSFGGRMGVWERIVSAIIERPLTGHGIGTQSFFLTDVSEETTHNTYMALVVETGILGLLLYMIIIVQSIRMCVYNLTERNLMWIMIILVWGITGLFHERSAMGLLWFSIAMVLAEAKNEGPL